MSVTEESREKSADKGNGRGEQENIGRNVYMHTWRTLANGGHRLAHSVVKPLD